VLSKVSVLMVGAVVCISAALAGDHSQDLKTGFLLGATPKLQSWGNMMGVVGAAAVMGLVLIVLNESYGIGTADGLPAPQATLMSLVIDGVLGGSLPWGFVLIGVGISAVVEFVFKQPALPFAVGVYLPLSLNTPILIGGLMRLALTKKWEGETLPDVGGAGEAPADPRHPDAAKPSVANDKREQGVLFASGLIAGAALVGVLIGGIIYGVTQATGDPAAADRWVIGEEWSHFFPYSSELIGTAVFVGLCWMLWHAANKRLEG
jgi:uncharacterized oligopeptide transporter (OPT) family protein